MKVTSIGGRIITTAVFLALLFWIAGGSPGKAFSADEKTLELGKKVFTQRCIICHGEKGDAKSEAAKCLRPQPIDFTSADDASSGDDTSPGMLYYRVLRGIEGSAMENFGTRLRVDDIWRVEDIEPFLAESQRSRLLFTTRDSRIAEGVGAVEYPAGLLSPDEAGRPPARSTG